MSPVDLLEQDDPGELVRKRHRAERELEVDARQLRRAEGTADDERELTAFEPAFGEQPAEGEAVEAAAMSGEQAHECALRQAPCDGGVVPDLDQLELDVAGEELAIVRDIVEIGVAYARLAEDAHAHLTVLPRMGCDTSPVNDRDPGAERHINIHLSPEIMGGVYANFANVSHSDYEFTVTFARVDHEVEAEEVPGVVVSRVNLSPRFMRELINAMEDNYSKWRTREGIKNLPEYGGQETGEPEYGGHETGEPEDGE